MHFSDPQQEPLRHFDQILEHNTAAHMEDKKDKMWLSEKGWTGSLNWGNRVLADCPTKRMGSSYSRSVMKNGLRFLSEKCFQRMHEPSIMLLISAN